MTETEKTSIHLILGRSRYAHLLFVLACTYAAVERINSYVGESRGQVIVSNVTVGPFEVAEVRESEHQGASKSTFQVRVDRQSYPLMRSAMLGVGSAQAPEAASITPLSGTASFMKALVPTSEDPNTTHVWVKFESWNGKTFSAAWPLSLASKSLD